MHTAVSNKSELIIKKKLSQDNASLAYEGIISMKISNPYKIQLTCVFHSTECEFKLSKNYLHV